MIAASKRPHSWIALLVLAALVSSALAGPSRTPGEWSASIPTDELRVRVYYFHNHVRCQTCLSMESMAAEIVAYDFLPEVDSGLVRMDTVDVQDEGQRHFIEEFDIKGPTLILVRYDAEGKMVRWHNLDRIWDLSEDPPAYMNYVRNGIQAFLEDESSGAG